MRLVGDDGGDLHDVVEAHADGVVVVFEVGAEVALKVGQFGGVDVPDAGKVGLAVHTWSFGGQVGRAVFETRHTRSAETGPLRVSSDGREYEGQNVSQHKRSLPHRM